MTKKKKLIPKIESKDPMEYINNFLSVPENYEKVRTLPEVVIMAEEPKANTFFGLMALYAGDKNWKNVDNISAGTQAGAIALAGKNKWPSIVLGAADLGHDLNWLVRKPNSKNTQDVAMDVLGLLPGISRSGINLYKKSSDPLMWFLKNKKKQIVNGIIDTGGYIDAINDSHINN